MTTKRILNLTYNEIMDLAYAVAEKINALNLKEARIYAIPRGGVPAAMMVMRYLRCASKLVDKPQEANLLIDDIYDSGATCQRYQMLSPDAHFYALVDKQRLENRDDSWVVFPWEGSETSSASDIPTRLLQYIGEDPERGGLIETPARFLKAWKTWAAGYGQDPAEILKVFEDGAESYNELILVKDIPVYSHCEHHLAPFFGVAHVGYIPNGKIVGLSKLSRLVDIYARRLQVQERLTQQVATALNEHLSPLGVGVVIECRHMCMESRGIQRQGATTTTSAMLGALHDETAARAEFLTLIKGGR